MGYVAGIFNEMYDCPKKSPHFDQTTGDFQAYKIQLGKHACRKHERHLTYNGTTKTIIGLQNSSNLIISDDLRPMIFFFFFTFLLIIIKTVKLDLWPTEMRTRSAIAKGSSNLSSV